MSGIFGENIERSKEKSVEWYTPSWVFQELGVRFDLDPSSPHDYTSLVPAETKYTIFDDGLKKPWFGRVWLNPPYGRETPIWMNKMIERKNGIVLVFSRTDASWCQAAMKNADAALFIAGRIEFVPGKENQHKKSRCGAGTVMFAFGEDNANSLKKMSGRGIFINLTRSREKITERQKTLSFS